MLILEQWRFNLQSHTCVLPVTKWLTLFLVVTHFNTWKLSYCLFKNVLKFFSLSSAESQTILCWVFYLYYFLGYLFMMYFISRCDFMTEDEILPRQRMLFTSLFARVLISTTFHWMCLLSFIYLFHVGNASNHVRLQLLLIILPCPKQIEV